MYFALILKTNTVFQQEGLDNLTIPVSLPIGFRNRVLGLYFKTFYSRNIQIFVSYSVCPYDLFLQML